MKLPKYQNAEADKDKILSDNKNKSGIYMWTNSTNGKRYIGSAENLKIRFSQYFNNNHLLINTSMNICKALIKYGYSNFELTILEYCEPSKCIEREGFYLKKFNPEYNISLNPSAPFSGRTHSEESKIIMSDAKKGEKNPMFGKNHTEEIKTILSDALSGKKNPMFGRTGENHPNFGKPKPKGAGSPSQAIEVIDNKNNQTTTYDSIREAARALNIKQSRITMYFKNNQQKPYKGIYTFKKIYVS